MAARCFVSSSRMNRRSLLRGIAAVLCTARYAQADSAARHRLAAAARAQVGITTGYDPAWTEVPDKPPQDHGRRGKVHQHETADEGVKVVADRKILLRIGAFERDIRQAL